MSSGLPIIRLFLFRYPANVPLDTFIGQKQFLSVKGAGQFFFVRNDSMNPFMTLAADADSLVGHFFLSKPFLKVSLPMDGSRNEVVLRQWLFSMTELTGTNGAT